jgi:hypothetical protein
MGISLFPLKVRAAEKPGENFQAPRARRKVTRVIFTQAVEMARP